MNSVNEAGVYFAFVIGLIFMFFSFYLDEKGACRTSQIPITFFLYMCLSGEALSHFPGHTTNF